MGIVDGLTLNLVAGDIGRRQMWHENYVRIDSEI